MCRASSHNSQPIARMTSMSYIQQWPGWTGTGAGSDGTGTRAVSPQHVSPKLQGARFASVSPSAQVLTTGSLIWGDSDVRVTWPPTGLFGVGSNERRQTCFWLRTAFATQTKAWLWRMKLKSSYIRNRHRKNTYCLSRTSFYLRKSLQSSWG